MRMHRAKPKSNSPCNLILHKKYCVIDNVYDNFCLVWAIASDRSSLINRSWSKRNKQFQNSWILWVINFLQTGQWSTLWAQSQQSWCPQRRAVFLGSVRQMAHFWTPLAGGASLRVSAAVNKNRSMHNSNYQENVKLVKTYVSLPWIWSHFDNQSRFSFFWHNLTVTVSIGLIIKI